MEAIPSPSKTGFTGGAGQAITGEGRKLVGMLRSVAQFAILVLQKATKRIFVGLLYAEVPFGLYVCARRDVA